MDLQAGGEHACKDKGLFRGAMRRERADELPRTSNIPSFVEQAKKKAEAQAGRKEKKRNILEGDEMQMYSLHGEAERAKVCRRSVSIGDR